MNCNTALWESVGLDQTIRYTSPIYALGTPVYYFMLYLILLSQLELSGSWIRNSKKIMHNELADLGKKAFVDS
jgi:hypothetical protein